MEMSGGGGYASPTADAEYASLAQGGDGVGVIGRAVAGVNVWTALITVFMMLVVYDQCRCSKS